MRTDLSRSAMESVLSAVADASPLVQHLTNEVTMRETANVTLHWGGLPVMADAMAEAGEMATGADAVLINTGRMTEEELDAMVAAGKGANEAGVPVVLDPVGYGATEFRVAANQRILRDVDVSLIKGNYGEVSGLAGDAAQIRGVESVGEHADVSTSARALAEETGATVVASGETDVVADPGGDAVDLAVGHARMASFVGTGCMLGSTLATFLGGLEGSETPAGSPTEAALFAVAAFGLAGERAAEADVSGPASYRTAFMDEVAYVASEQPLLEVSGRLTPISD